MLAPNRYTELNECLDDYLSWYIENQTRVVDLESCIKFLRLAADGRVYLFHQFRDVLMPLRQQFTNTSDVDQAIEAYTAWYSQNCDTPMDVVNTLAFLKKASDDSLHLFHLLRKEWAESQRKEAKDTLLYLPVGYR